MVELNRGTAEMETERVERGKGVKRVGTPAEEKIKRHGKDLRYFIESTKVMGRTLKFGERELEYAPYVCALAVGVKADYLIEIPGFANEVAGWSFGSRLAVGESARKGGLRAATQRFIAKSDEQPLSETNCLIYLTAINTAAVDSAIELRKGLPTTDGKDVVRDLELHTSDAMQLAEKLDWKNQEK